MRNLLLLMLCSIFLFSCNNNVKKLEGSWRLQNSSDPTLNSVMDFKDDGTVTNEFKTENMPNSQQTLTGIYRVDDDNVTVIFGSKSFAFKISWLSEDKFDFSGDKDNLIFARLNSPEDQWESNYLHSPASQVQQPVPSQQPTTNEAATEAAADAAVYAATGNDGSPHHDLCSYCNGSGMCPTCNGTGTNIQGSIRLICPDCHGDGVCRKCHGSGYYD